MRAITVLLAVVALGAAAIAQDKAVTKKEATSLVEEFVAQDTSASRRAEIVLRLRDGNIGLAATPLKKAAENEATVGLAIELATDLRVGGMFKPASKFMDGDHEDVIINYGLEFGEKGAAEAVWERWKAKDPDGTSWSIANAALLKHSIPLQVIEDVKKFLASADEGELQRRPAGSILRFQLGLGDVDDEHILSDWGAILANYKLDSKAFSLSGQDLLAGGLATGGMKVGNNRRLDAGGVLTIAAEETWQKGAHSFVLRIRVIKDGKVEVPLSAAQGAWIPTFEKGEWTLRTGNQEQLVIPGKLGEWTELRFDVTPDKASQPGVEVRGARTCKITVGGSVLLDYGRLNGDFNNLRVQCSGDAVCVVAGIERISR